MRNHVINLLDARGAHMTFDEAVANFPMHAINERPPNVPYTFWHLIEHLRICQWDILEFVRNPDYVSPEWPEGVWPAPDAVTDEAGWHRSLEQFHTDLEEVKAFVADESIDLLSEIPHAPGYTYLREALLVADHNAYHVGELAILRQVMDLW